MSTPSTRTQPLAAALIALAAVLAACTGTDPRLEDEPTPPPTSIPTLAPTATTTAIGSAHVVLTVATADAVTMDVTDRSGTLMSATSGTPGDGATVETYRVAATNRTPTVIRLTWVGGPCDSANRLSIDEGRRRLVLVQPECPGDAIATDRVLDLEFATPLVPADLETFLQDGLDS